MNCRHCILSGIDLGADTESILSYAAYFGAATGSTVKLLYVLDYLLTPPSYLAAYIEEEKKKDEAEISGWRTRITSAGVDAEYCIVLGRLHESFSQAIEKYLPGLLILGYRSHVLRPSNSERLIRALDVPMLVVRGKAAEDCTIGSVKIRDILCPVDFSENTARVVSAAKRYAELFGADIHLVHVIPSHFAKDKLRLLKSLEDADRERFDTAIRSDAETSLESLCLTMGISRKGEIFQGNPADVIASIARERKYSLIAMGAKGSSQAGPLLIGGTTETILKTSPCPVLILH